MAIKKYRIVPFTPPIMQVTYLAFMVKYVGPIMARVNTSFVHHDGVQLVLVLLKRFVNVHVFYLVIDALNGGFQRAHVLLYL